MPLKSIAAAVLYDMVFKIFILSVQLPVSGFHLPGSAYLPRTGLSDLIDVYLPLSGLSDR